MAILSQQQVATFPISDGELELWQPEGATYRVSRDNDGPGPTGPLVLNEIPPETCPWTNIMVGELWNAILSENNTKMDLLAEEIQGWNELEDLIEGELIDIYEPSYFNEWDQSTGFSTLIRNYKGEAQKFTPEMLVQRDNLNWLFNSHTGEINDQLRALEVVSLGENFGLAKCEEGSVFIPKSTLKHIRNVNENQQAEYYNDGSLAVGSKFEAWITFIGGKYPWRVTFQGVTNIY
tara:strand:- start:6 stop:710 length:705 start_codon:yes stop_codon:yes gene_type:complete